MVEQKPALLLSGPQHTDETRPVMSNVRRAFEYVDPLGIAIISAFLGKRGIKTFHHTLSLGNNHDGLVDAIEHAGSVWISARNFDTLLTQSAVDIAQLSSVPVIVGGYAPTFTPEAFEDADSRVFGEAEPVLDSVIEDLLSNRLKPEYDARALPPFDLHQYVWPDRSIFPRHRITQPFSKHAQEWQRGCFNFCTFCSPTRLQRTNVKNGQRFIRYRPASDIIAEIEHLNLGPGDNLFSVDLNTSAIPEDNLYKLFSYLKQSAIRWYTEGTIATLLDNFTRNGEDHSLLKLMSAADGGGGCYSFLYGADDLVVDTVKGSRDKKIGLLQKAEPLFREMGIPFNLSVVVGLDHHTFPDSFFTIARALQEIRVPYTFLHIATPYRGTTWGDQVYKEGRVFDEVSTHHNHRRVIHEPRNMEPHELQQGYYWLLKILNSPTELQNTLRHNFSAELLAKNPSLAALQTGMLWGLETYFSVLELSARGELDPKLQKDLDEGFRKWQGD